MDILSLILSCSMSITFDDKLIESIISNESFNDVSYVRVNGSKFGVGYSNIQDSESAILEIEKSGQESYIGLMGIPLSEAKNNGFTIKQLLDGCLNIQIGTASIDMFIDQCKAQGKLDIATCSIKKYADFTGQKPISFTNKVIHNGVVFISENRNNDKEIDLKEASVHLEIDKKSVVNNSVFINYSLDEKETKDNKKGDIE